MAEIRADEWGDKIFWAERITGYRLGEHSPQQALSKREVFVAVDGGTVVGFVAGHQTRRFNCTGELQWINVAKHKRGEGIGDKLVARIGAWFVEQNAHRICVNVAAENINARRLYSEKSSCSKTVSSRSSKSPCARSRFPSRSLHVGLREGEMFVD